MATLVESGPGDSGCEVERCGKNKVSFPFRLPWQQPHCGYPGVYVSCSERKEIFLHLPKLSNISVKSIDYRKQLIQVSDPDNCFPKNLTSDPLSSSHFYSAESFLSNFTLFSCPPAENRGLDGEIPCLSDTSSQVYAQSADSYVNYFPLRYCTKLRDVLEVPDVMMDAKSEGLWLRWDEPSCSDCEKRHGSCVGNRSGTKFTTSCVGESPHKGHSSKGVIAGLVLSSLFLMLGLGSAYHVYRTHKIEREHQVKIEKFLEDYKALKPTRYSYIDIQRVTENFKDKLGQGAYGTVYKGKLSDEVFVAVKILNNSVGNGDEFINEVGTMGKIHHVNVVRLVGFCADGFRRALVYEFLPNDSLQKFISSADMESSFLGWEKLQEIALGTARGIEYLHQGCDQRILHFDIKPHNVLLDHNFNPKIADFGLAKLCSKDQSKVSMTTARGTIGYIAPEIFSRNFGNVSCKSDVYSFGMLLLEMVGGRKNVDVKSETDVQIYFPEWIYNLLEHGEDLRIHIEEEKDVRIAKKLAVVGLWCIQWHPVDRPSMKAVVQMLEGNGEDLTMPPNPFASSNGPERIHPSALGRRRFPELEAISESNQETEGDHI
ncbi:hypothetical protein SLA2020_340470 [Shorea laevis]